MYAVVNEKSLIILRLEEKRADAVSSGYHFIDLTDYSPQPTVNQKFVKETNEFRDLTSKELRKERDDLIALTDWRATVDYPGDDKAAWSTYRQALRDLPQDYPDMVGLAFPVEPS
jgi:hypothetical protein